MDALQRHLRSHLIGSAAAIALLGRGEKLRDPAARTVVRRMRTQLQAEQRIQRDVARQLDVGAPVLILAGVRLAEALARWAPGRRRIVRTALCDVLDLEAMRDAIAANAARCEALGESERLGPDVAQQWCVESRLQQAALELLHADASGRAFAD